MNLIADSGTARVYAEPVGRPDAPGGRRDAERSAVMAIVRGLFGADAAVGHRQDGSPVLECEDAPEVSVSHCRTMAVLAVGASARIGVDVEEWREQLRRVAPRFLSEEEKSLVQSDDALLRAWTVKEAVYKAANRPGLSLADILWHGDEALACGRRFRLTFAGRFPLAVTLAEPIE